MSMPYGEIAVRRGLITRDELEQALERQTATGESIGEALVKLGFLGEEDFRDVLLACFEASVNETG